MDDQTHDLHDDSTKHKETKVDVVVRFFGRNSILYNCGGQLFYQGSELPIAVHASTNVDTLVEQLTSEKDLFLHRIEKGFCFNSYKNAKANVSLTRLKNSSKAQADKTHLLNIFYQGYDLWDYIYQCEILKRDGYSKSPQLTSQMTRGPQPQNQSFITQSQTTKYFSNGQSFIYQPNNSNFSPIDGIMGCYPYFLKDFKSNQQEYITYGHTIYDDEERRDAINACGWSQFAFSRTNIPQTLSDLYSRLEVEGLYYRAAAVAVSHFDFAQAMKFLAMSKQDDKNLLLQLLQGFKNIDMLLNDDIQLRTFFSYKKDPNNKINIDSHSGDQATVQDLNILSQASIFNNTFNPTEIINIHSCKFRKEIVNKSLEFLQNLLKGSTFAHPYLTLISKILQKDDELQLYLENELPLSNISIFDKMALWFRFLPHEKLVKAVHTSIKLAIHNGNLDFIPVVGRGQEAMSILHSYLDLTGDIQLAGTISAHLFYLDFTPQTQLAQIFNDYKSILNQLQLYEHRVKFEQELQEYEGLIKKMKPDTVLLADEIQKAQKILPKDSNKVMACCHYCKKSLGLPYLESEKKNLLKRKYKITCSKNNYGPKNNERRQTQTDIMCVLWNTSSKMLYLHSYAWSTQHIFRLKRKDEESRTTSIYHLGQKISSTKSRSDETTPLENAYVWCQSCRHGGHFNHIMEWFRLYDKCPVSDCQCECSII